MAFQATVATLQPEIDRLAQIGGGDVEIKADETDLGGIIIVRKGVKLKGPGKDQCLVHTVNENTHFLIANGCDNTQITGIGLQHPENAAGQAVKVGQNATDVIRDFRLDHLGMVGYGYSQAAIFVYGDCQGVIDHNYTLGQPTNTGFGYGVVIYGTRVWTTDVSPWVGTLKMVVMEDNEYERCRHAVAANLGAKYTFRHNHVHGNIISHPIDAHGGSDTSCGTVFCDVYGNLVELPASAETAACVGVRGGVSLVHRNTFKDYRYGIIYSLEGNTSLDRALMFMVNGSYFWNNEVVGAYKDYVVQMSPLDARPYIKENQNFFIKAMPGYVAAPYPHPLVAAAPADLRGDVNRDGKVNTSDITSLEQIIAEGNN